MSQDVSTNDLMQVMKEGFHQVSERFERVDKSIAELAERQERAVIDVLETVSEAINTLSDSTDARFDRLEGRFDHLEGRVTRIESGMVTKDYLDEKLFDLRGDAVAMIRRHEQRLHLRTI